MKQVDNGGKPKGIKITEECWISKDEWDFYRQWRKDAEARMFKYFREENIKLFMGTKG